MNQDMISEITRQVLQRMKIPVIKVGISARHVHLSRKDLDTLFGVSYELTPLKPLMGEEFAARETVTLVSESLRTIENVRILGPCRKRSQVEISKTDTFALKNSPPMRPSGNLDNSGAISIIGPCGAVYLKEGLIIANRHIHMTPKDAEYFGVCDNDSVDVCIESEKPTRFFGVQVRVAEGFNTEMHIDTDDANASGISNGSTVELVRT